MILELTYARGMRLWIDGAMANERWSFGDYTGPSGPPGLPEAFSISAKDGQPLDIAGHKLTALMSDVSFSDVYPGHVPTKIMLDIDGGQRTLTITAHAWGDPDEEEPTRRTLVNGQTLNIDEITLYLRAEG